MKYEFPPQHGPLDPSWLLPIESAAENAHRYGWSDSFDPRDFRVIARAIRKSRPDLTIYKHVSIDFHLSLDWGGYPYRWFPSNAPGRSGQYREFKEPWRPFVLLGVLAAQPRADEVEPQQPRLHVIDGDGGRQGRRPNRFGRCHLRSV